MSAPNPSSSRHSQRSPATPALLILFVYFVLFVFALATYLVLRALSGPIPANYPMLIAGGSFVSLGAVIARAIWESGRLRQDYGKGPFRHLMRHGLRILCWIFMAILRLDIILSVLGGAALALALYVIDRIKHAVPLIETNDYLAIGILGIALTFAFLFFVRVVSFRLELRSPEGRLWDVVKRLIKKTAQESDDLDVLTKQILFEDQGPINCVAISFKRLINENGNTPLLLQLLGMVPCASQSSRTNKPQFFLLLADPTKWRIRWRAFVIKDGLYRKNYVRPFVRAMLAYALFAWQRPSHALVSTFDLKMYRDKPQCPLFMSDNKAVVLAYRPRHSGGE